MTRWERPQTSSNNYKSQQQTNLKYDSVIILLYIYFTKSQEA